MPSTVDSIYLDIDTLQYITHETGILVSHNTSIQLDDACADIYKHRETDGNIIGYILWLIIYNVQLVTSNAMLKNMY